MSRGLEKKKQLSTDVMSLFADDLDESIQDNVIKAMPVNEFVPFHKNPFSLYEGRRFDNMVDSIRAHGILVPIIARSFQGGEHSGSAGQTKSKRSRNENCSNIDKIESIGSGGIYLCH